jgi:hypothetical protein
MTNPVKRLLGEGRLRVVVKVSITYLSDMWRGVITHIPFWAEIEFHPEIQGWKWEKVKSLSSMEEEM